jgi:hypothetical protein
MASGVSGFEFRVSVTLGEGLGVRVPYLASRSCVAKTRRVCDFKIYSARKGRLDERDLLPDAYEALQGAQGRI